ncbi:DNA-3-methyladenine glycosylase 2 family protein [Shewanella colwelliana]|uniref:DNA-3-methyladenine glycosylase 2 family protein n=1 Tax=Shewanella colwelliana TaxID=23 RepID=UPI00049165AF|nr:AlkA N-terminal domain-containing protein [Shewanella colwelliana]
MNTTKRFSDESFRRARLARDARFDGLFYVGVLSTGIYCRPICPAMPAKEENVRYFNTALAAANHGLRPCLRCRPDSAPHSNPWMGNQTSVNRALTLINEGILSGVDSITLEQLAEKLGITSRYLRELFKTYVGASPKQYALYQQLMFAKQLLHQTTMPITEVAFAAGFNSVRRFNEAIAQELKLTPSAIRKQRAVGSVQVQANSINLKLSYRPPFNWAHMRAFYQLRAVDEMEWLGDNSYGRTITLGKVRGYFTAVHNSEQSCFGINIVFTDTDGLLQLKRIVSHIRRLLDLDADLIEVEARLSLLGNALPKINTGVRIPGVWSTFEAGCRAILGQQVSVEQAVKLLKLLTAHYGERVTVGDQEVLFFPSAEAIAKAELTELKMPGLRKSALRALAVFVSECPDSDVEQWLKIKGIGPWTVNYVRLRGLSAPDCLLADDLVVKNQVLANISSDPQESELIDIIHAKDKAAIKSYYLEKSQLIGQAISPWGSYLTFQLWSQQ